MLAEMHEARVRHGLGALQDLAHVNGALVVGDHAEREVPRDLNSVASASMARQP